MLVSLPKNPRDARPVTAVLTSQIFGIPIPGGPPRGYPHRSGSPASAKREQGEDPVEINNRTRGSGSSRLDSILERVNGG